MTRMEAPEVMLRRFRRMQKTEGIQAFLRAAGSSKPKTITQRLPAKPQRTEKAEVKLGEPTPERAEKAQMVAKTTVPPFNSQILGAVAKFARQLGPEPMMVLERLLEVGVREGSSRGLTAGYDGCKVDSSRVTYQHLTEAEAEAHEAFQRAMLTMPPELRKYAMELVLEQVPFRKSLADEKAGLTHKTRTLNEIGGELSGYSSDGRYSTGAVIATLRIIAWCVQRELGVKRRRA